MSVRLERLPVPVPVTGLPEPSISSETHEQAIAALRAAVDADWVAVYGDREHNGNLLFLTGFDPRFEEALLLLGPNRERMLLVGNEGIIHAAQAVVPLEVRLAQSFSLMGQPRDRQPSLAEVLADAGVRAGQQVGVVGWKYLESFEAPNATRPAFVPAGVLDALAAVTATEPQDVTRAMMHPLDGIRAVATADRIAAAEWAATRASSAIFRVLLGTRPGMTEREAATNFGWAGEPVSMHPIVASGGPGEAINGLRSASNRLLSEGDGITAGIGFWGSLCCRAGLLSRQRNSDFDKRVVQPYFSALVAWYQTIGIGRSGGDIAGAVDDALEVAGAAFRPLLNPGHLISYDEWVHSPMRPGSPERLRSGMLLQCDIIPAPLPPGEALNCEDTVALADETLRLELEQTFPDLWQRVTERRDRMHRELGIDLAPEVLPLSIADAHLPPYWLDPSLACTVA